MIEWLSAGIPYEENDTVAVKHAKIRAHHTKLEEIARRKVMRGSG